jgi:hypothetical protein
MNETKDGKISDGSGEELAPEGATPAAGRREGGECRDAGEPTLPGPPGGLPRRRDVMSIVLKRVLIAAALMVACWAILAAMKAYGVWVLSGIAVVLFALGLLRKDKKPVGAGDDRGAAGDGKHS